MKVYLWSGDYGEDWNYAGNWYTASGNGVGEFPNSINDIAIFDEAQSSIYVNNDLTQLGQNITIGALICNTYSFSFYPTDNYVLTTKLAYFDTQGTNMPFGGKINGNVVYNNIGNSTTQQIYSNTSINGNIIIKSQGLIQSDSATLSGNIIINGIDTTIKNFTGNAILAGTNCKLVNSTGNVLRKGNLNGFEHNGGLPLDVSLNGLG
jgi:hypothetical protein